ncbi:hypothetical protein [Halovivax cerinus]|uniref:Uncharacterized protein n=1 Tax=Halovivax cerinus TaxID=1487865 RepID=A0ABD5NN68_9EURY|nr:hypothetical protein [Halovivax cerinus]
MNTDRIADLLASRAVLTVASSTVLLTLAFVGVAVVVEGQIVGDVSTRLPVYVLVFALGFIVSLLKLDNRNRDGMQILIATAGIGTVAALLVGLATEGAVYLVDSPEALLHRGLIVVFLAAGIICTGLGIWGVRHWREFVGPNAYTRSKPANDGGMNDAYK